MTAPAAADPLPPSPYADVWRLAVLVAVAAVVHWWVVVNTSVTARDSIGFARYALALSGSPSEWPEVLRGEAHPPGYPLSILAVHTLVRTNTRSLEEQILPAAQVASSLAGVLIVFPMYRLGRRLFDRWTGFWATLLLQFLPVFARDTADGLSEGPFLLCAAAALSAGVQAIDRRRWGGFLACGLLSGLAYLVRPEGALVGVAAVVVLLARAGQIGVGRTVAGILAVAIGFAMVGGPYMAIIGGFTNKPALRPGVEAEAARGPLFAESLSATSAGAERVMEAAAVTGKEWLKAGHYGVAVFALIGLAVSVGRVYREPRFWLPLLYAAGQLGVVLVVGFKKGYVSERHLLPVALVGVLFAAGGLPAWYRLWAKLPAIGWIFAWPWFPTLGCVGLVVAGALPIWSTRLHDDRLGHKIAGEKLRAAEAALTPEQKAGVVVLDHYQWCQFFSGRATWSIPTDPDEALQRVVFVVLEFKDGQPEKPGFDSERHQVAIGYYQNPPEGATRETVYFHPPGDENQARMKLVKITLPVKKPAGKP
ncbi:MAG: glycosyltransferase family 39 protein [Fimbriiglobus sp.]|jgi:hypothetical protein|nr:glycosyltransferase family 39 protein [Fimbriiglobus sp.]